MTIGRIVQQSLAVPTGYGGGATVELGGRVLFDHETRKGYARAPYRLAGAEKLKQRNE